MKRIEGGQEGIQYLSKGSQQFATESNFWFITTNESKNSFQVKTNGGIIFENKKNKLNIHENGLQLDILYLEENIFGNSTKVIGGDCLIEMAERKSEYQLKMNHGVIKYSNFNKYLINGNIFEIDVAKFLVKRGEYGLDWENDLIVSNPSQIKFMSLNGDINFSTKNGERIVFENEKPNGIIEFLSEKSLIKTDIAKMEHKSLQIICPKIKINKSVFIEDDSVEIFSDVIQLKSDKIEIGCIKMRKGLITIETEHIQFGGIEITKDRINLSSDGKLGINIVANNGGIKMLGNLQWNYLDSTLIQTDESQKIISIGEKSWKLRLEGKVEIENCTIIGKNKRTSENFCEVIGDSLITWQIGNNIGKICSSGILFESGLNKIEIYNDLIKESGKLKRLEIGILEEIGLHKIHNWDKLIEKGLEKKSKWDLLENSGEKKSENWKIVEEQIIDYHGVIQGKYELCFGEANGLIWNGSDEFIIDGVFKKNNKHTIFNGDNKLIFENSEIEIRNCLKWKENELLIGVGKRMNNIFLTEEVILMGGRSSQLAIFENKINIGETILVNSNKQTFIGDLKDNYGSIEKKVIIGIATSSIFLNEKQVDLRAKKIYILGNDTTQINSKIIRIQGETIGIGSSETKYIELIGDKIVYTKGVSQIELDESFVITMNNSSKFYIGEKGVVIDSDDLNFKYNVHTKAEINLHSTMGNINIDSTIGDIQIKNNGSQIFMSREEKILGIWSENNILMKGKKIMMDGDKYEVNAKNFGIDVKTDIDIQYGRKFEIIGGKEIEFQSKEGIKLVSDIFGEIKIADKSEINIKKSLRLEVGDNYLVDIDGEMEYKIGKKLKICGQNIVDIWAEEGLNIATSTDLKLEGSNVVVKSKKVIIDGSNTNLSGDELIFGAKQISFKQRGFGEMSWEVDGKMRIISKIEGNRGDVMEILAESNTHEKSIHLCSRIGGIYLEGQTIGLGGKVQINGVEILGGENRLSVGGMVEAAGLKIGKNMFIEPRGISLLQREEIELRNMDLKLGGRLDVESIKVKKILGGTEVEGKMRVIGGIECKGGIVGEGVRVGNWDGGNRSCLKIEMKGTVWTEGVNISGGGRSIVVDGDIVCAGGGRILAHCPREGRQDISKLLEEVTAMGESGVWDMGHALQKLTAIVGILAEEKEN